MMIKLTWNYLCIKQFYCIPASQSESSIPTEHGIINVITYTVAKLCTMYFVEYQ